MCISGQVKKEKKKGHNKVQATYISIIWTSEKKNISGQVQATYISIKKNISATYISIKKFKQHTYPRKAYQDK